MRATRGSATSGTSASEWQTGGEARRATPEQLAASERLAELVRRGVVPIQRVREVLGMASGSSVFPDPEPEGPTVVSVEQGGGGLGILRNGSARRGATSAVFLQGRGLGRGRRGKKGGGR